MTVADAIRNDKVPEEQTTCRITCDECGYSEIVSCSRLAYEEAKRCPICRRGKMWWVPSAEEARRREVRMLEEERRILPAVIILPIGLGLGLAVMVGLVALARERPPTPSPGRATFYGRVTDSVTGEPVADVLGTLNGIEFYTDAGGNYAFTDLEPRSYTVTFGKEGYETIVSDIILVEGNNELNVEMVPIAVPPELPFNMVITKIDVYDRPSYDGATSAYWHVDIYCDISNPHSSAITHSLWIAWAVAPNDPNDLASYRLDRKWDDWQEEKVVTLAPAESRSLFSPWIQPGGLTWNMPMGMYHGYPTKRKYYFRIIDELGNWSPVASVGTYV